MKITSSFRGPTPSSMARPIRIGVARLAADTRSSETMAPPLSCL
jgi:hypothetical protein